MFRVGLLYVFRLIVLGGSLCSFLTATSYAQSIQSKPAHTFRGIYAWLRATKSSGIKLDLTNSNVDGMSFWSQWNLIEPQSGVFDWSNLDAHVNAATAAGKHFTLTIEAGVNTPQWLYGLGASSVTLSQGTVPIPWDPTYLQYFKGMVARMGAHYSSNPALDGVHITGLNYVHGETHLINSNVADCAAWMRVGYTSTLVVSSFSQILTEFTDDFPGVQLASMIMPGGFCLNATTIDDTMDGKLLALGGWVPQNNGWNNHWIMLGMTGDQEGYALGSSLPAALNLALAQPDTRYLEIYHQDLNNPMLTASIAAARTALLSR